MVNFPMGAEYMENNKKHSSSRMLGDGMGIDK